MTTVIGNDRDQKISWLRKHQSLFIASIVSFILLALSLVFVTFYPWFNVALSLVVGGSFLYKELRHRAAEIKLIDNGLLAPGKIIDKDWHYGKEDDFYYITYTFTTQKHQQISGKHEILESWYKRLEVGDIINIAFDSVNPNINVPIGVPRTIHSLWRIVPGSIVIAGVTFVFSFFLLLALGY